MATLREVIAGLLTDLTQSSIAADLAARDHFNTYRDDQFLSQIGIPRITIKEARIRLRFAISEQRPTISRQEIEAITKQTLIEHAKRSLLPGLLKSSLKRPEDVNLDASTEKQAIAKFESTVLSAVLKVERFDSAKIASASDTVLSAIEEFPVQQRKLFSAKRVVAAAAKEQLRNFFNQVAPAIEANVAQRRTQTTETHILLTPKELQDVGGDLHEIEFTLTSDDLRSTEAGSPSSN